MTAAGFNQLIERYGAEAKERLAGPGEREALLILPVSRLVEQAGELNGFKVVAHNEVRELDGSVRPDFGVRVNGILTGHIELKAPGTPLDPSTYGRTTHNFRQWQRLKELPNLLHTNGTEFRLWRYGELAHDPVHVHTGNLATHRGKLSAPARLELVISDFLQWEPSPIVSVSRLVETLAPLARLLREEVQEAVKSERRAIVAGASRDLQPFTGIAKDWRRLLFPGATDAEFADGFAQTVVFALLLALSEGIDLKKESILTTSQGLEAHHTLMGRTLRLLTEHVDDTATQSAIEIIVRVLSATDWSRLERAGDDLYLHLYEDFLAGYDPAKRRKTGSYYTPVPIVDAMVRLTDEVLKLHMGKADGLRNPSVSIVDPAMGTGTYPLSILRRVGDEAALQYGPGARPEAIANVASRLYGIEIQSGPFSVAELRITAAVKEAAAQISDGALQLFVADTLEDPYSASDFQLSYTASLIAQQRQRANQMKREQNIQVCIGNPPYKDHAGGLGGWIESGIDPETGRAPLDAFKLPGNGKHERHLSNLYAYFWRWATWKVFESTKDIEVRDNSNGIATFITATGYLAGPGFKGMRKYLRETSSHGWIINVSPEGKLAPGGSNNAVFNIETPVAIGIFARCENTSAQVPADIRYIDIGGTRQEKFDALAGLTFDHPGWRAVRTDWTAPFTPAARSNWDDFPSVDDLFPWRANGIMAGRGWIYSPSRDVLDVRLRNVINEPDQAAKSEKFREGRDSNLSKTKAPLPGLDTEQNTRQAFGNITMSTNPAIVACGFRALDRQYVIADSRLMSQPSPSLWAGRIENQVFAVELHSEFPRTGPGLVYSALIPDVHHFRGSGGGRALPKLHPNGEANLAIGLQSALEETLGSPVSPSEVFAYVAGVAGHSGFVDQFEDELMTPGIRIPLTSERQLWDRAVVLGEHLQWLQTYGEAGAHPDGLTDIRDNSIGIKLPVYSVSVGKDMPDQWTHDPVAQQLHVGAGRWDNVTAAAVGYTVGGTVVLNSWLGYRMADPKKKVTSPLDSINATHWDSTWSEELTRLLAILEQLVLLEEQMNELMSDILASPLVGRKDLSNLGVQWPVDSADRRPKQDLVSEFFE